MDNGMVKEKNMKILIGFDNLKENIKTELNGEERGKNMNMNIKLVKIFVYVI